MKILIIYLGLTLFNGCFNNKTYDTEYKKLEYNESEEIGQLASSFKTDKKYNSWYFLKSSFPSRGITILYKSLGAENILTEDIKELNKGFFKVGKLAERYYYLLVVKNGEQIYITEKKEIVDFLGEIDTKEEALLLAMIEGFNIDTGNLKGSSYKRTKEGYSLLLMKASDLPLIEFRQYEVKISKKGKISWKMGDVYCTGYVDCYETDD